MAVASEQRRLLAILVGDIVGYSNLMARFESETFQRVKELQSSLIVPSVARNRGEIVKYTGDGFIATFASALDAVRAAVEVQSGAKAAAAAASEDRRIMFRIGINAGDVIVVPGDIYGDSVNIAARLQGLAKPGGICVSRAVRDTVKGKFEIDFNELGDVDVKNIPDPVGTYELQYQAIAWTMERHGPAKVGAPRLGGWQIAALAGGAAAAVLAAAATWVWMRTPARSPATPEVAVATPTQPPAAQPAPPTAPPPAAPSTPTIAAPTAGSTLKEQIIARIEALAPRLEPAKRSEQVDLFLADKPGRALVVAPGRLGTWRSSAPGNAAMALERAIEACMIHYGEPCAPVALDDKAVDEAPRVAPRVIYSGLFEPSQIPTNPSLRTRLDALAYRTAPGPKAAAIHPMGYLHVVTGPAGQRESEERALAQCAADPGHRRPDMPCFLYAVGDQVVLPRRASAPLTPAAAAPVPAVAIPPPAAAPTPVVATPPPAAPPTLREQIAARIAARAPALTEAQRLARVDDYLAEKQGRALAVAPGRSGTWRVGGHQSAAIAEERALEGCMIRHGEPCVLVAVNEVALQSVVRPAERVVYSGLFDPAKVPAGQSVRTRQDVMAYRGAPAPKAMAIHAWGLVHIVLDAPSQREAEEKALVACTGNPIHGARDLPCYLYAVGDQVVLPRRASSPITP